MRHKKASTFKRYNSLEVTSEYNPYKKLSDCYYYKLNKNYKLFDMNDDLNWGVQDIVNDLTVIFGQGKELNALKRAQRNATQKFDEEELSQK